jgi:hypothetical protein
MHERALMPLIFVAALLHPLTSRAANAPVVQYTEGASQAFARYIAGLEHPSAWSVETIEIEAALPKLKKQGRLRAIRRMTSLGELDYQVLESAGDQTVRQQVIGRYLSAQMTASELPAASVAITPANYKFRYKGIVKLGESVAYAFQITPRKKLRGLMNGELWLEGETGAVLRQSGYLVKSPSIFVKRVDITREMVLNEGIAQMRLTHLSVDTRLVGLADLTVTESPLEVTKCELGFTNILSCSH